MKTILTQLLLFLSLLAAGQQMTTIKVIVPNKTDEVFITGNQESLANWDPAKIKMEITGDYEREITLELSFPAELKFTRGGWHSEGIIKSLSDNPNLLLPGHEAKSLFVIKGWNDEMQSDQFALDYQILRKESKIMGQSRTIKLYLPDDYSPNKKYPVIYITDANSPNFNMAMSSLKMQTQYNSIPECILVGITQIDRNGELDVYWSEDGRKFKDYIFKELVPFIDEQFSTSGFNAIIGHSDGAEFNHLLMLQEGNPFRGFINITTNLNYDVSDQFAEYFNSYEGEEIYYFIANGKYDHFSRIEAGNKIAELYEDNSNEKISFTKKDYPADHINLVPMSLNDGLLHIFKDYRNLSNYGDFKVFAGNYHQDLSKKYGIETVYDASDVDYFFMDIMMKKDLKSYDYLVDFVDQNQIFTFSTLDRANHYFFMEMYPETIEYWNKTVDEFDNIIPQVYYWNFSKAVDAYVFENDPEGAIDFLERSKKRLPQYSLEFDYYIAKTSAEKKVSLNAGKAALENCKENYKENGLFTEEDLKTIEVF